MGLRDSCCRMSPRNDTTTSGAEINLSRQEKDKTNHLLQESHLMPVSKSTGMNGFCKDRTATWFFPLFSAVPQIEVYKVCCRGNPGAAFGSSNAQSPLCASSSRDLEPAGRAHPLFKKKKKSHKVSNSEAGRVMAACKPSCGPAGEPYTAVQSPAFPLPNPNKSKPLPLQKVLLMLLMLPKKFSRGGCGT